MGSDEVEAEGGYVLHAGQGVLRQAAPRRSPALTGHRPEVLFVCVHNAGRSQMAAGMLQKLAGDRVLVRSAGSEPSDRLNPRVVEAMHEIGIDVSAELPTPLTGAMVKEADVVVTMGCG